MKNFIYLAVFFVTSMFMGVCCVKSNANDDEQIVVEDSLGNGIIEESIEPLKLEDIVFRNGFEDGNLNVWDDWDKNPAPDNTLQRDLGPFNSSNNTVMRLRVKSGRGGADVVKVLPSKHDKLYARWYMKWEKGFNFNAKNHGGGLFAGDRGLMGVAGNRPDGTNRVSVQFEYDSDKGKPFLYTYYRGMNMDCSNPVGSCWGDHFPCFLSGNYCKNPNYSEKPGKITPKLVSDKWYCVELMVDLGTPSLDGTNADGVFNFWIDGVEYGPFENLWLRTTSNLKLGIFDAALFHHGEHSVEGVLYDNIVVATKRIGMKKVIGE